MEREAVREFIGLENESVVDELERINSECITNEALIILVNERLYDAGFTMVGDREALSIADLFDVLYEREDNEEDA